MISRRTLLSSSAAIVAASSLSVSEAQGVTTNAAGPFTVRAGDGRPGGQWLVQGEKAFSTKVSGADVRRAYAALEVHTPPGRGPELHVHNAQNEFIFMLIGSIGLQCGSERAVLRAGDAFMAPLKVPHAYVTLGSEPAKMLHIYDPAGEMEGFFAEYAALISVPGQPDQKKIAEVYAKHGVPIVGPRLEIASFSA